MYANSKNILFSHVWLIVLQDISECRTIGTGGFEETKGQAFLQEHQKFRVGNECHQSGESIKPRQS